VRAGSNWKNGRSSWAGKRGTTWRKLSPEVQAGIRTEADAIRLMQEHTSLIKRPVVEKGDTLSAGFDEALFREKYL
jgi:arsenate reductase-like glutaredoxin family protein